MLRGSCGATASVASALVLVICPLVARAQRPAGAVPSESAHVMVVGTDYAFVDLPTTLSAGPTLFAFENHGLKRHELSIVLLKPGVAVDSLVRGGRVVAVSSRAISDSIIGLLLARPGERSGGQLYVNLLSGRTYVVVCTLRDTPDAPPHAELGMVRSFRVH